MTVRQQAHEAGELAKAWRSSKAAGFASRAERLGTGTHPEVLRLLQCIAHESAVVDAIWDEQLARPESAPWWADGVYDGREADRQNDAGVAAQKLGKCSTAFDHFTEAIRLRPLCAAHHANRAAVALRLGRADIAAGDAANAVQRDPSHVRAHLRGGQAALKLQLPQAAADCFSTALRLSPGLAAAKAGAQAAARLATQHCKAAQQSAACDAARAPLPDRAPSPEAAAEALLAADAMLAANPDLPAARFAHVEALILAGRFSAATGKLCSLRGADRDYLEAEAVWRRGHPADAISFLESGSHSGSPAGIDGNSCSHGSGPMCAGVRKLAQLLQQLHPLAELLRSAEEASHDGREQECVADCGRLLVMIEHRGAAGLEARVLRLRASASLRLRQLDAAEADVDMALAAMPGDVAVLLLRAEVLGEAGRHQEALLALQGVLVAAPGTPGLLPRLQAAATLAAQCQRSRGPPCGQAAGMAPSCGACAVLCIASGADPAAVRSAYRRQAARWHPDRWAATTAEEQEKAAAQFLAVQHAYEALGGRRPHST